MNYHILHRDADISTNKWVWVERMFDHNWRYPKFTRQPELICVAEHNITEEQLSFLTLAGHYVTTITEELMTVALRELIDKWL